MDVLRKKMALITNLGHLLDKDGCIPGMSKPVRRLAEYLCGIVKAVTTRQKDELATGVRCRRWPKNKRYPGEITAFIDRQDCVSWSCPVCGGDGRISGWRKTMWDWWREISRYF